MLTTPPICRPAQKAARRYSVLMSRETDVLKTRVQPVSYREETHHPDNGSICGKISSETKLGKTAPELTWRTTKILIEVLLLSGEMTVFLGILLRRWPVSNSPWTAMLEDHLLRPAWLKTQRTGNVTWQRCFCSAPPVM